MQLPLPFGPIINKEFLSNHWLEHRLPLEPEWSEFQEAAKVAAEKLLLLWNKEKSRAPLYGDEAGLEEKFIQPVFEILGWHTKYQTYLQGRIAIARMSRILGTTASADLMLRRSRSAFALRWRSARSSTSCGRDRPWPEVHTRTGLH
jgi:hypothetical protein